MNEEPYTLFWLIFTALILLFLSGMWLRDDRLTKHMAEKQLCYQTIDRTNANATYQWGKCK
jgi:hypothetical protein